MAVKIYPITKPKPMWQVRYHHQGEPVRKHFSALDAAEKYKKEIERTISQVGTAGIFMDAAARADYTGARQLLDQAGHPGTRMLDLAREHIERHKRQAAQDTPIAPLFEEFIRVKRDDENKSARWVETLEIRGKAWIEDQAVAQIRDITRDKLLPLRSRPGVSARTRLSDMAAVSTFLAWLVQEKWIPANPLDEIPRPTADATAPRVLTATQVKALLDAAREKEDGRLLRYFALAVYAGLRPGEIERLTPDRIQLHGKNPVVRIIGGKRRQRVRVVPVLPPLRAWLKIAPEHWPISNIESKDRRLFDEIRAAADLVKWEGNLTGQRKTIWTHWQDDICRHTFISLRMAMTHDEGLVALEAGNSPDVIHAHYLSMIDQREKNALLALRP